MRREKEKEISAPNPNTFLVFPFPECCIRVIWLAMRACPVRVMIRRQTGRVS